ncbi:MAG: hypothetical protein JWQ83_268 [Lacunisphaera sp.]|nr:hypothetical protein [Lacunisphaera sp.]MDB6165128.1 hypothetical protein [Lacunisphaera sp.]
MRDIFSAEVSGIKPDLQNRQIRQAGRDAGCYSRYGSHGNFSACGFRFSFCAVMNSFASSVM